MHDPLDAVADTVPSIGRRQLVLVDGRTFAISDEAGQMTAATHGLVHDDLRHLSLFAMAIDEAGMEVLASSAPTPLSAVIVARLGNAGDASSRAVVTRRRWVASGLREDVHVHNTSPLFQRWTLRVRLAADFAHVFDVKAGLSQTERAMVVDDEGWAIDSADATARTRVRATPRPDEVDLCSGTLTWHLHVDGRSEEMV